jgi:exodeoxyribonuclease VII small subunit
VETEAALSFEEAYDLLSETVGELEKGDLSLAQSISLFEQGMRLVGRCNDVLDQAELRVHQLVPDGDGYTVADLPE